MDAGSSGVPRREPLQEILAHRWHRPVLEGLREGPRSPADVAAALRARPEPTPGPDQVGATLRALADLGLAAEGPGADAPAAGLPAEPTAGAEGSTATTAGTAAVGSPDAEASVAGSAGAELSTAGLGGDEAAAAGSADAAQEHGGPGSWRLTGSGRSVLAELEYLDQLVATGATEASAAPAGDRNEPAAEPVAADSRHDVATRVKVLNPFTPHPARRYNYWLGGKDNFEADRRAADELERLFPGMRAGVRANREVLRRVVRHLTAEEGVRQFLDIGTGLPTANNTHEVAQDIAPDSRVVYVDNDPLVLAHARALLTSAKPGRTAYIDADLREPDEILRAPEVSGTFDLTRPVALLLVGILHFVPGDGAAKPLVDRLMGALPAGSFLFVTHVTNDFLPPAVIAEHEEMQRAGRSDFWMRSQAEVTELFEGLELLAPGVVPTTKWRPDADTEDPPLNVVNAWAAVGRKLAAPAASR